MTELRAFALIDQLQKQMVAYIGSTSRGYYPVTGQAALFLEIAPGMEINPIPEAVMQESKTKDRVKRAFMKRQKGCRGCAIACIPILT